MWLPLTKGDFNWSEEEPQWFCMGAECRDPSQQTPRQPFATVLVSNRRWAHLTQMQKTRAKDSSVKGRGRG